VFGQWDPKKVGKLRPQPAGNRLQEVPLLKRDGGRAAHPEVSRHQLLEQGARAAPVPCPDRHPEGGSSQPASAMRLVA